MTARRHLYSLLPPIAFIVLATVRPALAADPQKLADTIDSLFAEEWKKQKITPSQIVDETGFLRRLSLDLTGVIPPAMEVVRFIKDRKLGRRHRKIEAILGSSAYSQNFAEVWSRILLGRVGIGRGASRAALESWLRFAFGSNMPYNEFVRELVSAGGRSDENGATNYILGHNLDVKNVAGNSAAVFLGIQIRCAECHNHPMEKWTQRDFWGYAAFFAQMRRTNSGMGRMQTAVLGDTNRGEAVMKIHNGGSETVPPKLLNGQPIQSRSSRPRRQILADYLADKENSYVARSFVNRMWHHFFGRGIVNPIDDLGESNPPIMPDLLDELTKQFVSSDFDIKFLIRGIVLSKAYQRSSTVTKSNVEDRDYFSHALLRMMTPEQLFRSLLQAMGENDEERFWHPQRLRQLQDRFMSQFIFAFANDENEVVENFQGTIPQALMLMNGRFITDGIKVNSKRNLGKFVEQFKGSDRIELLYLTTLSRRPNGFERDDAKRHIRNNRKDPNAAYENLFWSLLNSSEFLFNH